MPAHANGHTGGFIKTIIRVLRCVGHYNSKLLLDKVGLLALHHAACRATSCIHAQFPFLSALLSCFMRLHLLLLS